MTKTIRFTGYSDDLVHIEDQTREDWGEDRTEEFDVGLSDGMVAATFLIKSPDGVPRLKVHAIYDGCWSFAPGMVDEDTDLEGWQGCITGWAEDCDYSMCMAVRVLEDWHVEMV